MMTDDYYPAALESAAASVKLTTDTRNQLIVEAHDCGLTLTAIAAATGLSRAGIRYIINQAAKGTT